ncbi:MAG: hypothetical protein RL211_2015 [Pseudomonadota bacterium]
MKEILPPDFNRNVHCIMGLPFDAMDIAQAEHKVRAAIANRSRCFFSTPNLNFLMACRHDTAFRQSVLASDMVLADGMPIVWLARLLGIPVRQRVAGSTLFEALRRSRVSPEQPQIKVFFFGGPDGVAEAASNAINADSKGGMQCVGFLSPGFGTVEDMSAPPILEAINNSGADMLVVSLGARKGQAWITHNLTSLNVPVISHLGAVVNFVAGTVQRAPTVFQCLGLEWLWRIKEEPQLWRRYFDDGLGFARLLATDILPLMWRRSALASPALTAQAANRQLPATAQVSQTTGSPGCEVTLAGALTQDTMQPLRDALGEVTAMKCTDVAIDMTEVTQIDSAFLGTLLLLKGHQVNKEYCLIFNNVPYDFTDLMNIFTIGSL